MESLQRFKKPWAHEHKPISSLLDAVKVWKFYLKLQFLRKFKKMFVQFSHYFSFPIFWSIKPTVLIGSSGIGKTITKEVVEAMTAFNEVISLQLQN